MRRLPLRPLHSTLKLAPNQTHTKYQTSQINVSKCSFRHTRAGTPIGLNNGWHKLYAIKLIYLFLQPSGFPSQCTIGNIGKLLALHQPTNQINTGETLMEGREKASQRLFTAGKFVHIKGIVFSAREKQKGSFHLTKTAYILNTIRTQLVGQPALKNKVPLIISNYISLGLMKFFTS